MLRGERDFDDATMTGLLALVGNEHRSPARLAGKVARCFTLFRRRA